MQGYIQGGVSTGGGITTTVNSGNLESGQVGAFHLASGSVVSGRIASGHIGINHLASGAVRSGVIASGQVSTNHFASGAVVRAAQFVSPSQSGSAWSLLTEEPISGVRAVCVSQSGTLQIAMASVSGRMPAIGVVLENVLSGLPANVYTDGMFQVTSGMADYSGWLGKPAWVGRSGQVVQWSGSFNSGGLSLLSGGDFLQRIGVIVNSGAVALNVHQTMGQNLPQAAMRIYDATNREFGL